MMTAVRPKERDALIQALRAGVVLRTGRTLFKLAD